MGSWRKFRARSARQMIAAAEPSVVGQQSNRPKGRGWEDVEAGTFTLEGELPVNTDGGLKSFGHPVGASGIRTIYEGYKQLQGKAGPRQVKDAELALTHTLGGPPQVACVTIVGNAPPSGAVSTRRRAKKE